MVYELYIAVAVLLLVIVLMSISFTISLKGKDNEISDLKDDAEQESKDHTEELAETEGKLKQTIITNRGLGESLSRVFVAINKNPLMKKHIGKGSSVDLSVRLLEKEYNKKISEKDKKINAQKSVIYRRDRKIKKLLLKIKK